MVSASFVELSDTSRIMEANGCIIIHLLGMGCRGNAQSAVSLVALGFSAVS